MVTLQEENESSELPNENEQIRNTVSTTIADPTSTSTIEDELEDIDESLYERIVGLAEMFPDIVQQGTGKIVSSSCIALQTMFKYARSVAWIVFSTSAILVAPVIFEVERAQMEEIQRQQQRQILLGPGAAVSGGVPGLPGLAPSPRK